MRKVLKFFLLLLSPFLIWVGFIVLSILISLILEGLLSQWECKLEGDDPFPGWTCNDSERGIYFEKQLQYVGLIDFVIVFGGILLLFNPISLIIILLFSLVGTKYLRSNRINFTKIKRVKT